MRKFKLTLASVLIPLPLIGCASLKDNAILRDMAVAGAVGAALGHTKEDNKEAYSVMYAGIAASLAGAYSSIVNYSPSLKAENERLKKELDVFQSKSKPQITKQGSNLFEAPLPQEIASLIHLGEWKKYKLDQWVQDPNQPNTWHRQVEMIEIIPPVAK